MKRIISLCLIFLLLAGFVVPTAAQRNRDVRAVKTKADATGNRFASVRAYSDGTGVLVEWEMASEVNNAGFDVIRLDGESQAKVNPSMMLGSAAAYGTHKADGEKYSYFDAEGTPGAVYSVRSYGLDGRTAESRSAAVETVNDLAAITGLSGGELALREAETRKSGNVTAERLELPKELAKEVAANRVAADAATHAWVVAQPGVRIGVRRDGFYRVTRAELQAAGFNTSGDPSLWQLYREGVEQAISIGPNADHFDFYGKAVDTPETDMAVYFLLSGNVAGKRISLRSARPVAGTVTSPNYYQVVTQKQRINYLNQVFNGEAENYWGASVNTFVDTPYNFTLTGLDLSVPEVNLEVKFQGYSFDQHIVKVTINGHLLASATGASRNAFSKQYTIPSNYLVEGANTIVFRAIGVQSDFSLFDSISIGYPRRHLAVQDRLKFFTTNYRLSKLSGFTAPNVRVFDMTNENAPVEWTNLNVIPENGSYSVRMPSDRGRSMQALTDSAFQAAASILPNDPAMLRTPANSATLLIIAHRNFYTQAQAWANYRASQGINVKLIDVSEIYDEFGYGDMSSASVKSFLQYAKVNWQGAPSYVLLIGDASFDSRNYEGLGYNNFVPTRIVTTVFGEAGSDDSLTDFNGDGLAEMAIGRITARTAQTVTNVLAKVTAFEAAAPTPQGRGSLFAYDCYDANNNYDFEAISTRLKNQLPGSVTSTMAGRCDTPPPPGTPQSVLISTINTGKYVVNYAGHGTTGAWASTDFFSNNNVPALTNASNLSIFTMLTCFNGYFLHVQNKSLGETLLEATNGGAVAAWASTGETTPDVQEAMATRFFLKLGQGQIQRLGDLINDAKTVIPGGTDVRLSWALLGDPMLKVRTQGGSD